MKKTSIAKYMGLVLTIALIASMIIGVVPVTAAAADSQLSALTTTAGTLTPSFASNIYAYNATVNNNVTVATVTPTASNAAATLTIAIGAGTPAAITSGTASSPFSLGTGFGATTTTVTIVVTFTDFTSTTYTLTINRNAATDATLSSLTISKGILAPPFAAATINYTDSVAGAVASVTVTAVPNAPALP